MRGYWLDGDVFEGHYYASMAFIAPFAVGAMIDSQNQSWRNALWEAIVNDNNPTYYGDTLKMLALLALSNNWWTPESVACPN